MKIIQTHEQADFDALASLLAAGTLNPESIAVRPKRMNRNVTAFLSEFNTDFPFKSWDDLPDEKIASILLVDTQTIHNTSRMAAETVVSVIDHHQPVRADRRLYDHSGRIRSRERLFPGTHCLHPFDDGDL